MRNEMVGMALACTLLSGCGVAEAGPTPQAAPPEAPAPAPPPPTTRVEVRAVMMFANDELVACVEAERTIVLAPGADWTSDPPGEAPTIEGLVFVPVANCRDSLDGRPILATCETTGEAVRPEGSPEGTSMTTIGREHIMSFAGLEQDARMRECLQAGGRWTALDRDSPEYQHARLRHDASQARRDLEAMRARHR